MEWHVGDWGECSKDCGGGIQHRKLECQRSTTKGRVSDKESEDLVKPATQLRCNKLRCGEKSGMFKNKCFAPPHSQCVPVDDGNDHQQLCDCSCQVGFLFHRMTSSCDPLPDAVRHAALRSSAVEFEENGPRSFRSENGKPLKAEVCKYMVAA